MPKATSRKRLQQCYWSETRAQIPVDGGVAQSRRPRRYQNGARDENAKAMAPYEKENESHSLRNSESRWWQSQLRTTKSRPLNSTRRFHYAAPTPTPKAQK